LLAISDIHANYEALTSVLDSAKDFDAVVVAGDLVDYGPDPDLVIDVVASMRPIAVRGNHDHAAAFNMDCGCGPKTHDISVLTRESITAKRLEPRHVDFLRSLPLDATLEAEGLRVKVVHGSPTNQLYGYLYPWEMKRALCPGKARLRFVAEDVEDCDTEWDVLIVGHTHHQFSLRIGRTLVVNPGSVGQPRDGDPRASFTIIEIMGGSVVSVTHRRVKYNVEGVIRKLEEALGSSAGLEKLRGILINGRVF